MQKDKLYCTIRYLLIGLFVFLVLLVILYLGGYN